MASQLAAASGDVAPALSFLERFTRLCVSRRVPISIGLFSLLIALDLFIFHIRPRNVFDVTDPLAVTGLLLVIAGLGIRSWAAGTLKKQKQLATTGPYALVRHPLYFGSFLLMLGFGTLIHDPLTLWIVAGPVAWLYWHAIKSEERKLASLFPEWPSYKAKVPAFVPYWPARTSSSWSLAQWRRNSEYRAILGAAVALVAIKLWHGL